MLNTLKQEIKHLKSLRDNDYMGDPNGILNDEIKHCENLIKLYEKA